MKSFPSGASQPWAQHCFEERGRNFTALRVCGIGAQRDAAALHFFDEGEELRAIRLVAVAIFFTPSSGIAPLSISAFRLSLRSGQAIGVRWR